MLRRLVSGPAVGTLVLGYCLAVSAASPPSSQNVTSQPGGPMPAKPPASSTSRLDPPAGHQMLAIERHAKINMILYTGRFDRRDFATTKKQLEVFAQRTP